MANPRLIPTEIVDSVSRSDLSPRQVAREFSELIKSGGQFHFSSRSIRSPDDLLARGLKPKHKIELFQTSFYFTNVRQIPELRFFVGYVVQPGNGSKLHIYPRVFYKDLSLVWRSASHFSELDGEIWVGKGDVKDISVNGEDLVSSDESTTDLPLEMQSAMEQLLTWTNRRPASGNGLLDLILRKAPPHRIEPYQDFVRPLRRAASFPGNLIHGGKPIAHFRKPGKPESLTVVAGYEPDFEHGILEHARSHSKLYGGRLHRMRIASVNRKIQYLFFAGVRHIWISPPQAFTTELSSYGVRTISVQADEDLFIPGYEYHHLEETENGQELYSQIPPGYAGEICPIDDAKADASPWLDQLPVIQSFRSQVMGQLAF